VGNARRDPDLWGFYEDATVREAMAADSTRPPLPAPCAPIPGSGWPAWPCTTPRQHHDHNELQPPCIIKCRIYLLVICESPIHAFPCRISPGR
jgi:hypothetical protein